MLNLFRGRSDDRAQPAFRNVSTCKKWLQQLQFTNPTATQAQMRAELEEFDRYVLRGLERMQVLETLRESVHQLQADCAKKLSGKPLPLSDAELAVLTSITGLWQAMFAGYSRCLMAVQEGDKALQPYAAQLCHRCMTYSGNQIFEYLRNGYEFDGEHWRQFHSLFLYAEESGLLSVEVEDDHSNDGDETTCRYVYIKTLLSSHARVHELSPRQQALLELWLPQWEHTITIDRSCVVSRGDAPPLAIDPGSSTGLQQLRQEFVGNSSIRFLPMVPMSKLLRVKTILLQQGQTPQQLDLGEDRDRSDCLYLLNHLHKHWCEYRQQRQAERQDASREVLLRYGLEEGYGWIGKRPFDPAAPVSNAPPEIWRTEDLSLLGARLTREGKAGARVAVKQLVAVQVNGEVQLASSVWVSVTRGGDLRMGIRFLPGKVLPAAARIITRPGLPPAKPVAVLLLSAMPELGIPASLLIPRNLFQFERELEITPVGGAAQRIKLKFSVERGVDFDRVSFAAA